jgi:hypothetical protein
VSRRRWVSLVASRCSRLVMVRDRSYECERRLQLQKGDTHVQRLVMTADLFSQPVDFFFHPDVSDREDELLDSHLLIDEMISVGF